MIDLRRLRALRELANRGTIAAAADALYLTPSAVSQQLAALEQQVGQPLLIPNGRTVRLTPAAEAVLGHADAVFSELERMDATLAALAGGERGRVRIGSFATGIVGLVVPAVGLLRERAPGVELSVQEFESPEVFHLLARGDLDLGISMESDTAPRHDDERFTRMPLMRDLLDVALAPRSPAGKRVGGPTRGARVRAVRRAAARLVVRGRDPRGLRGRRVLARGRAPFRRLDRGDGARRRGSRRRVRAAPGAGRAAAGRRDPPDRRRATLPAPVHRLPARRRGASGAAGRGRGAARGAPRASTARSAMPGRRAVGPPGTRQQKAPPGRSARVHAVAFLHAVSVGLPACRRSSRSALCLMRSLARAPVGHKYPLGLVRTPAPVAARAARHRACPLAPAMGFL